MTLVLAPWLAAVFVLIGLIHLYWAVGGTLGSDAIVPQVPSETGEGLQPGFKPSALLTSLVAVALLLIAVLVCLRVGWWVPLIAHRALQWLISAIAIGMFARAIGDSQLIGFFKEAQGSRFALLDTWVYSPLCVVLGAGLLWVAWG